MYEVLWELLSAVNIIIHMTDVLSLMWVIDRCLLRVATCLFRAIGLKRTCSPLNNSSWLQHLAYVGVYAEKKLTSYSSNVTGAVLFE